MVIGATAVAAIACRTEDTAIQLPTTTAPAPTATALSWSVVSSDIRAEFATPDLAPGRQRIAAVFSDAAGLIKVPVVRMRSYRYPDPDDLGDKTRAGPIETVIARFHEFPLGTRGIYVSTLEFDRAGGWSVEADIPRPDGTTSTVEIRFEVGDETESVDVGEAPPPSRNRTAADVPSLAYLTTGSHRDPGLYQTTIANALKSRKPSVVVVASPAFCTNAVCGPQVEVLSEVREKYGDTANYVHVDYYDNPQEIQGDLDRAIVSPVLSEWGLESQEWTFVIGKDGLVSARFENFAPREEIEAALDAALAS